MTVDGIAMLSAGLLFAGHETTVTAIDRGVTLLLIHPEQADALRHDPALIEPAVEEILRSCASHPEPAPDLRPRPALLRRRPAGPDRAADPVSRTAGPFPALRLAVPVESLRGRDELLTGGLVELPVTW